VVVCHRRIREYMIKMVTSDNGIKRGLQAKTRSNIVGLVDLKLKEKE
jgi:hypothetical protein